jgi:hypothetical protein
MTDLTRDDFYTLINTLNSSLPADEQLDHDVLGDNFDYWWKKVEEQLGTIPRQSRGETRTAYKWLLTFEDLAIHEPKDGCIRIWFITADVFKYAVRDDVKQEIESNLAKVQYRFLVRKPDGDDELRWMGDLEKLRKQHEDRLDYRCYKQGDFEKQAATDYAIVESSTCKDRPLKVYVRIPIESGETEYWFDTDERAAHNFHNRFEELWNSPEAEKPAQIALELV